MDLVLLLWAMSCNSIFELNTCSLAAGDVGQSNIIGSFVETYHFFSAAFCLSFRDFLNDIQILPACYQSFLSR